MTGDGDLVRAAQRGDTIAMNDLLDRLTPYVCRLCGPIAFSGAQDAAQEALIAVFKGLRSLRDPDALYGWVRAIAVREAVRVARRDTRTVAADLGDVPAPGDPQLSSEVYDVLARLAPEHRAVLVLRDVEGMDEREAARILELPKGTVKSRLHRARDSFRKAWNA